MSAGSGMVDFVVSESTIFHSNQGFSLMVSLGGQLVFACFLNFPLDGQSSQKNHPHSS